MRLEALSSMSLEERRVELDALVEHLPEWLELIDPSLLQPRFRDRRHDDTWRLFVGGIYELGATQARVNALNALQVREPTLLLFEDLHRPMLRVQLAPFFLMEHVVRDASGDSKMVILNPAKEGRELLAPRDARLPSEAEWEFAFEAVQVQREHWEYEISELCADGWAPHLAGLQTVQPLRPGGPDVVRAGSFDANDANSILPSRRWLKGNRLAAVRPALDVPKY